VKKILILAANPQGTSPLRLDQEVRDIAAGLERARKREQFVLEQKWAVRPEDLRRAMLDHEPEIVHFSGHGAGEPGLLLENDSGQGQLVTAAALAELFELFVGKIECVLLNACYSQVQAQAICQHVDYVIGMNQAIGDKAAIQFAVGFYDGLGAGRTVETAYKLGCNAIRLAGIPEYLTPTLQQPESPLYVEHPKIESRCYETLLQRGSLVRIKAPQKMGKTSLMARVLARSERQGYRTVHLDLNLAEEMDFGSLDKFLQWFCVRITQELQLPNKLADSWDERFSTSKVNSTAYFESYLLPQVDSPLVLCLDNVDLVFPYSAIASEFLGLLRAWHEKATTRKLWQKLRLVVVHSTEVYIPLKINESPFNVGVQIELPELTREQVEELAKRYQLNLTAVEVTQLMAMVGGHPYLVSKAFSHLKIYHNTSLEQLLQAATTEAGIYRNHLRRHWGVIQQDAELKEALKLVVSATDTVRLASTQAYKLDSMGLVRRRGNDVTPRCNLYRIYFSDCLAFS